MSREKEMFDLALSFYKKAYAPYSKFHVGAVVEVESELFGGCNIENASYGGTVCAERVAILKAVSEKGPKSRVSHLTLVTKDGDFPCGLCLQVMSEFMEGDTPVTICSESQVIRTITLNDLMPQRFELQI